MNLSFQIAACFLAIGWFTAEHFLPWLSWHSEVWVFAGVMLAGAGLLMAKERRRRSVRLPSVIWAPLFFAGVVVVQTALGLITFAGDAWVLLFYLVLCAIALTIGYQIELDKNVGSTPISKINRLPSATEFAVLLLLGGSLSAVLALIQSLDIWTMLNWVHRMPGYRRPGGNLGQPNQLATLILFSVASLVYLFEKRRVTLPVALPMAAVLLLGAAVTESRTGIVSLLAMVCWWMAMRGRLAFRLSAISIVSWLTLFMVCLWLWPLFLNFFYLAEDVSAQLNIQAGTRLVIWPQLWAAAWQQPWFGWGLREVSEAHNAVLHAYAESEPFTYAHNLLLELFVGMGMPLTVLFMVATCVWLWRRACNVRDVLAWYCLAVAIPFGVHSMLEFPFAYAYLLGPVMFLIGLLEARLGCVPAMHLPWRAAVAIWAFFSVLMAWSAVEYVAIEEDFRVARFEAIQLGHTPGSYERPRILLLTQLAALIEAPRLVPAPGMQPEQLELARRVALHFPGPATQNRYALSLALNGDFDEARRQLKVIRAMHGEKTHAKIVENWRQLAYIKYPQLQKAFAP